MSELATTNMINQLGIRNTSVSIVEYIGSWAEKATSIDLPRHHEVPCEEFAPEAWNKTIEICGGIDNIDPIRERCYGDAFIINFGSEDKAKLKEDIYKPQERSGWHNDDDWYRMFLDSTGNAMTVIHCFSDVPARGGGTWLCEDGMPGEFRILRDGL